MVYVCVVGCIARGDSLVAYTVVGLGLPLLGFISLSTWKIEAMTFLHAGLSN